MINNLKLLSQTKRKESSIRNGIERKNNKFNKCKFLRPVEDYQLLNSILYNVN
jgi:hypothetical protein